jgi:hypothetical protein
MWICTEFTSTYGNFPLEHCVLNHGMDYIEAMRRAQKSWNKDKEIIKQTSNFLAKSWSRVAACQAVWCHNAWPWHVPGWLAVPLHDHVTICFEGKNSPGEKRQTDKQNTSIFLYISFIYFFFCLHFCLSVCPCLSLSVSVCLCLSLSVSVSVCVCLCQSPFLPFSLAGPSLPPFLSPCLSLSLNLFIYLVILFFLFIFYL